MEAITYEELMKVNGGRRTRGAGRVRGRRTSWWSRHKKTVKSHGRAAVKGADWALRVITIGLWF